MASCSNNARETSPGHVVIHVGENVHNVPPDHPGELPIISVGARIGQTSTVQ